jgi:hypothetical protein
MDDRLRGLLCLFLTISAVFGGARADWSGLRPPAAATTGRSATIVPVQEFTHL